MIAEADVREGLPIFSYCLMPNHGHFVVRPTTENQVTQFFRWLTNTPTMRWHPHHHTEGTSHHLYQRRCTLSQSRKTNTCCEYSFTWNGILSAHSCVSRRRIENGAALGAARIAGQRGVFGSMATPSVAPMAIASQRTPCARTWRCVPLLAPLRAGTSM